MQRMTIARAVRDTTAEGVPVTRFIVSTDKEARDGHIVDQDSWQLDSYRSNPVVLWGHDYSQPPIGRATSIEVVNGNLEATVQWDTATDLGATVARQYDEGYLHAVSVGWRSHEVVRRSELPEDHPHHGDTGFVFRENEMLEFSAVPVPADAGALAIRTVPDPEALDLDALADRIIAKLDERGYVDQLVAKVRTDKRLAQTIEAVVLSTEGRAHDDWLDHDTGGEDWYEDEDDSDDLW